MAIDIIDEKLIEVLQQNARISISEISKRINLSLSAVSDRLKKLESSGIITRYTAILDPLKMDKTIAAVMMLSVDNISGSGEFSKLVASEKDILVCSRITGDYDYILKIVSADAVSLQKVIDKVKNIKNVKKVHTDILLDNLKMEYSVPPIATK